MSQKTKAPALASRGADEQTPARAGWTAQRIARLRQLWAEKLASAEIAKDLGGVTRCAVIGKARRLGLAWRGAGRRAKQPGGRPGGDPRRPRALARSPVRRLPPLRVAAPRKAAVEPAEIADRCTVLELTPEACRWPVGEPGTPAFHFCGAKSIAGRPYCARHFGRAYLPPAASAT